MSTLHSIIHMKSQCTDDFFGEFEETGEPQENLHGHMKHEILYMNRDYHLIRDPGAMRVVTSLPIAPLCFSQIIKFLHDYFFSILYDRFLINAWQLCTMNLEPCV